MDAGRIRGYDIVTADAARGAVFGKDDAFFAGGRLDDLASVHAGLVALERLVRGRATTSRCSPSSTTRRSGRRTRSGAAGPFLADVLERIRLSLGADREQQLRANADSWCVSSDVGHSVHPNYADKHDPVVQPLLGSGPILKINANQRYATDGAGAAAWHAWCAGCRGHAARSSSRTTPFPADRRSGPITATRLGIRTVDVGIPILSMHSARELAGTSDLLDLARVAAAFFRG